MKLFQTIFNGKTEKPQPSEIPGNQVFIPIDQSIGNVEAKLLAGKKQADFFMSQLERKFPDSAAQLQLNTESFQFIANLEPQVFDLVVKYVCNDKKPSRVAMRKCAVKLLEAANKLKIEPLKQICDRHLTKTDRNAESALDHIIIGLANDAPLLTSQSFTDIDRNHCKVKDNKKWLDLVESRPSIYKELYTSLYEDKQKLSNKIGKKIGAALVIVCCNNGGIALFYYAMDFECFSVDFGQLSI